MSSIFDKTRIEASLGSQDRTHPDLESNLCTGESERVELDGRRAFFKLRRHWSIALMGWISVFIGFHIALTVSVGLGWLDFLEYQWLIPLITVENFLQIVGMGYVVVRFLYPADFKAPKLPRAEAALALPLSSR